MNEKERVKRVNNVLRQQVRERLKRMKVKASE